MKQVVHFKYYAARLIRYTKANGQRSAALLIGKNLIWPVCEWIRRRRLREHEQFDARYGIDTQLSVRRRDLELSAPGALFANGYEGTPIPVIRKVIAKLKTDLRRFTFIDLGSGKGRVLLIAAQYPFKSVIGIEFSPTLHNIALSNIAKFSNQGLMKTQPISLNRDATTYDFSQLDDKILFCANPFSGDSMTRVIDNLERSLSTKRAETILIYLTPVTRTVRERLDAFELLADGSYLSHFGGFQRYLIYKITSPESVPTARDGFAAFRTPVARGDSSLLGRRGEEA